MSNNALYANIILPLALPKLYTYNIPEELKNNVEIGKRVIVQFGKKKYYSGIVYEIHNEKPKDYEVKNIISVLDETPVVFSIQLTLWEWIAKYYCCSLGEVYKAALPAGLKLESETRININSEFEGNSKLSGNEELLVDFLDKNPNSSINQLSSLTKNVNTLGIVKSLLNKNIIVVEEKLKDAYRPKYNSYICLSKKYNSEQEINILFDTITKAPQQQKLLLAYLSLLDLKNIIEAKEIDKKELLEKSGCTNQTLNTLIKKGVFTIIKKRVDRIRISNSDPEPPRPLNDTQQEALLSIEKQFAEKNTILLHGVTSSGKTEIYIHLIQKYLNQKKQILYLLPEIALTSQIINRLQKVFGKKVGVYHSKFSDNERVETYNNVKNHECEIILGVRSSVFLPFNNLGLIIIDEEHENSYKQFDPSPRYNARDTTIVLGNMHQAKVLLGTATPSLESHYNAKIGKYGIVKLSERYQKIELPEIILSNTRDAKRKKQMKADITPILFNLIQESLDKKEQVILFQNRRGFAPFQECTECGWIPYCDNCDVSLTYHKHMNRLICHYCGFSYANPTSCKACGSSKMELKGFGTEKIESDMTILFPNARIARMDLDSTRKKHAYSELIADFENRKIDILIGTQMVTKGLDFDNVSLVGILNADTMLNFPDFRAFEKSFQLMAQVSGRAGRKNKRGKVVIQTSNTNHKIINYVVSNCYEKMFESQIVERKKFKYPPFYRLITITVKHKKPEILNHALKMMTSQLKKQFKDDIIGPQAPLVSRIQNWYLKNYLLKIPRNIPGQPAKQYLLELSSFIKSQPNLSNIQVIIDVDPM